MNIARYLILMTFFSVTTAHSADIHITAEKRVEWHQKDQKTVAIGNAIATKEDLTVQADTLTGYYNNSNASTKGKISRVTASGNVRMSSPKAKALGDNLDYDLIKDEAVLIGKPAQIDTGTETITAEDHIIYYPNQQKAIALGNVTATDKDKNTLYADKMVADFKKNNKKSQNLTLDKVDVFNNVKIVTNNATVTADKGTYLPQKGLIKLFDNVTINQQGNILQGDKAETNLNTGISKLISTSPQKRVHGIFKEKK